MYLMETSLCTLDKTQKTQKHTVKCLHKMYNNNNLFIDISIFKYSKQYSPDVTFLYIPIPLLLS